jgi:hypothetical protein
LQPSHRHRGPTQGRELLDFAVTTLEMTGSFTGYILTVTL